MIFSGKPYYSLQQRQPRPQGFSLKKWVGPSHFLTRKPWGRGCPRGHFYFLHFIYFQTVFCVSSSSSDASTYFQIETPCSVDFFHDTFAYEKKVVPCLRIFFLLDEETSSGNWRRERNAHRVVRKKKPSKGGEKKGRYRILTGELWINFDIATKERWCSRQLYCTCSLLDHRSMKLLLVLFSPDPSLLGWNACPSQCTSLLCSQ